MARRRRFRSGWARRRDAPKSCRTSWASCARRSATWPPNTVPGFVNQKSPEVLNAVEWLKRECGLDDSGAEQAIEYIVTGRAVLGAVPTTNTIIAERFFDEGGGMQLVVHAPFGARINKAWGLSLRKRFCVSFNFELQAAATDNGVNISLAEQHSFPLADVFHFLHENTVKEVLQQAALLSPLLETRWRWDANRALALLRYLERQEDPAAGPAHALRRSAGVSVSGCGAVPGKCRWANRGSRPSPAARGDERYFPGGAWTWKG